MRILENFHLPLLADELPNMNSRDFSNKISGNIRVI